MDNIKVFGAQFILISIIVLLLASMIAPAWKVYQIRLSINSGTPSGDSLAERYLILGDWPASTNGFNIVEHNQYFKITTNKIPAMQNQDGLK